MPPNLPDSNLFQPAEPAFEQESLERGHAPPLVLARREFEQWLDRQGESAIGMYVMIALKRHSPDSLVGIAPFVEEGLLEKVSITRDDMGRPLSCRIRLQARGEIETGSYEFDYAVVAPSRMAGLLQSAKFGSSARFNALGGFSSPSLWGADLPSRGSMLAFHARQFLSSFQRLPQFGDEAVLLEIEHNFCGEVLDLRGYAPEVGLVLAHDPGDPVSRQGKIYHLPLWNMSRQFVEHSECGTLANTLRFLLAGNEMELDLSRRETEVLSKGYWSPQCYEGKDRIAYADFIYPAAQEMVERIVSGVNLPTRIMIDLMGGDGSFLARVLCSDHPWAGPCLRGADWRLIDSSLSSTGAARERLAAYPNVKVYTNDVLDIGDLKALAGGAPSLITALGGMNKNVMTRADSMLAAKMAAEALAPGGIALFSGKTPLNINAADLEAMGLRVLNKVLPKHYLQEGFRSMFCGQMYVAQKPWR